MFKLLGDSGGEVVTMCKHREPNHVTASQPHPRRTSA